MNTIGLLEVFASPSRFKYKRLSELAAEQGLELRSVVIGQDGVGDDSAAWARLKGLIEDCNGYFMQNDTVLLVPEYAKLLRDRIKDGHRLAIVIDPNAVEADNAFLAPFDLTASMIKIRADEPVVTFQRGKEFLADDPLLSGVDCVALQGPFAIWTSGESRPLVGSTSRHMAIRADSDLKSDMHAKETSCVARWDGPNGQGVIAFGGHGFFDPYVGATGVEWPGINRNERLAKNLLHFLIGN